MQARLIRQILLLVIAAVPMTGCNDHVETHYSNVDLALRAGAFEHGWLPSVLKPDATEIREWHDIDTNEIRGRFALNNSILNRLQCDCKPASDVPRHLSSTPGWWPEPLAEAESARNIFRCDNFFVAADPRKHEGYFWESKR